jgi:putative transposase
MASVAGREALRLQGYDYSAHGAYLVTTCVAGRRHLFGEVVDDGAVRLSALGEQALACLEEIERHHPGVRLDEHVVMPDHVHAIVVLPPGRCRGQIISRPYYTTGAVFQP